MADADQVLKLAAIIRKVDGTHSKGSAALAESILDHPDFRAALAKADGPAVPQGREPASVTEQPSDEELADTYWKAWHEYHDRTNSVLHSVGLRAVLARWGNPAPQPPADGEVAELAEMLKGIAYWRLHGTDKPTPFDIRQAARLTRAAELLQRQAPQPPADGDVAELVAKLRRLAPQNPLGTADPTITRAAELLERQVPLPVAVSERLPEPSDCAPWPDEPAASAWCWVGSDVDGGWSWEQRSAGCLAAFPDDFTHWLPAHALPLPEVGE